MLLILNSGHPVIIVLIQLELLCMIHLFQGDEMKFVKHFQYMAWPAQGVPTSTNSFTNFVKLVRTHISLDRPTVVHCR